MVKGNSTGVATNTGGILKERLNLQPIKLNSATADRIPGFPLIGCKFKLPPDSAFTTDLTDLADRIPGFS